MSNLVQTVINAVTPDLITKLSGLLGESPGSVGKGVSAAAPALLAAALQQSSTTTGANGLLDMIGQVTDDFEDAFVHLALMPEAENQLISQLVNLRQRLTDLWSQPGEVEARLQSVVHALEVLAGDVGASR